ncbi:MAG TPA: crotonase/enoyl-CoA hydratase family protein [Acidimicrobiales bacterium]|nr:crotonase/enoyl-CoA hydratase family protein [Acidimicrobiales bacterium]
MSPVRRARRGTVEVLTIDRLDAANAIDAEVEWAINDALDELEGDDRILAVVLTGAGDRVFSAGADLKASACGDDDKRGSPPRGFGGMTRGRFAKLLIAAVNGTAVAGGFELVLGCDLVVAEEHARFGLPEVKRGLLAGAGGVVRLAQRVPPAIALELAMTGEPIDARRAYELGLVNRVVPRGTAVEAAVELAQTIAHNAPLSVRASRELVYAAVELPADDAWRRNDELVLAVSRSEDAREGPLAFAEKRLPCWSGK